MATVAVLGAGGTMGAGMARNLAAAGHEVRAWNRSAEKLRPLAGEEGIVTFSAAAEATAEAEAILTMLSDAGAVLETVDGPVIEGAPRGTIWVQASTVGVAGAERCAKLAAHHGVNFVDAPVLGTKQPAEEGELIVLASGADGIQERVEPLFEAIGKRTIWLGPAGAATRLKVAIASWIVAVVEGAAETIALAEALGADPEQLLEALAGGPLDLPYMRLKAGAMLKREFPPSFRLALAAKDAGLAVEAAHDAGLELPMLESIADRLREAAADHGDEDLAATYLASAPREPVAG